MWMLVRSELAYSKSPWLAGFVGYAFLLGANIAHPFLPVPIFVSLTTIVSLLILVSLVRSATAEKRTRAIALLPIPSREVALASLLYLGLFQLGTCLLWILNLLWTVEVGGQSAPAPILWGMVSQAGLILAFAAVLLIRVHLGAYPMWQDRRLRVGLWLLVITVAGMLYSGWLDLAAIRAFMAYHYVSWSGALALTLLGLTLSWAAVVVYVRRPSYLE